MEYKTHKPLFPLSEFISHFTWYKNPGSIHSIDRFLPDGNIELVFSLKEDEQFIYDNSTLLKIQGCKRVWLSGIRKKPISIPSGKNSEMFIIHFKKGKASAFLNIPLNEISDHVIDAELLLGNEILELRDQLIENSDPDQKFKIAENNFRIKYQLKNSSIDKLVKNLISESDSNTLKVLRTEINYSSKHFIKLFKEQVGINPNSFLRIHRFQKTIQEIENGKNLEWSALALDCGYYDQSHFNTDFKHFSGFTPEEYLKLKSENLNYVPVR